MTLETALAQYLLGQATLMTQLASYRGAPAFFERVAPPDTDPGWDKDGSGNTVQYPRLVYRVDRDVANNLVLTGTLHVELWALDNQTDPLETLQQATAAVLNGAALTTSEGLVSLWLATAVPFQSTTNTRVIGVDLSLPFVAFPQATTYPPDPVATLVRWSGQYLDPHITVAPAAWAPSDAQPALYWRLVTRQTAPTDLFHRWWWETARIEGHVLAPDAYSRGTWVRLVAGALKLPQYRAIAMDDHSPMRTLTVSEDLTANPYRLGQIKLDVRYGVLATEAPTQLVNPPVPPVVGGPPLVPPLGPPSGGPPGTVPTGQPVYVSSIDTGEVLNKLWWTLTLPQDSSALSGQTDIGPIETGESGTVGESGSVS